MIFQKPDTHRNEDRTYTSKVSIEVYLNGDTVEEAIAQLREAAEGLTDPTIETHGWVDRDRDTDYGEVYVVGTRPATEEEIAKLLEWETQERERAEARSAHKAEESARLDQAALNRARRAFPDQFR